MVCQELEADLTDSVENIMDLDDLEAGNIIEYQVISQRVPLMFNPPAILNEKMFDNMAELLEFFSNTNPNHRQRCVAMALQNRELVKDLLSEMTITLGNRVKLEEPMSHITAALQCCAPKPHPPSTAELAESQPTPSLDAIDSMTTALGEVQLTVKNIGKTFGQIINSTVMEAAATLASDGLASTPANSTGHKVLSKLQKLVTECTVTWPFESRFADLQQSIASGLREMSATADLAKLMNLLKIVDELEDGPTAQWCSELNGTLQKMDIYKLDKSVHEMLPAISMEKLCLHLSIGIVPLVDHVCLVADINFL